MSRRKSRRIEPWTKVEPHYVGVRPWPSDTYPDCPWTVRPVKPRKRDFWKVLRGQFVPELVVGRRHNLRMLEDTLAEVYVDPLAETLNAQSHLLDAIPKKETHA